ncbi:unnamed protein product [Camellia sinensis]
MNLILAAFLCVNTYCFIFFFFITSIAGFLFTDIFCLLNASTASYLVVSTGYSSTLLHLMQDSYSSMKVQFVDSYGLQIHDFDILLSYL